MVERSIDCTPRGATESYHNTIHSLKILLLEVLIFNVRQASLVFLYPAHEFAYIDILSNQMDAFIWVKM